MEQEVSLASAKASLSELTRTVEREHARVHITKHGHRSAVLLAEADLEALMDTIEELSDVESVRAIAAGRDHEWSEADVATQDEAVALVRRDR
ncbi:MAG: type II toxin-antitoxin system Phd/YefM family antitoxin [Actinomycetia bacterium]|nr:type II toxin-antitoxin system Phd/YefM family antitoxin [Actinomycetes bacterium]